MDGECQKNCSQECKIYHEDTFFLHDGMEIRKKERNWASAAVLKGMTWQTNAGMTFADGVKK